MTEWLRRLSWPLPWWYLPVPAVAVFVIVLGSTWQTLSWPYQEWQHTNAQFHQQLAWVTPLSAAIAAVVAGRLTAPSRIFALPVGSRAGAPAVRLHLMRLGVVLVGSYLLGLAPLTTLTVVDSYFGGPDPLVMLSGLVGLTAAIAVGYLIGLLARTALIAPVPFLLFFALTAIGSGDDTYAAVVPMLYIDPALGQVENTAMVLFRCGFFLLVTAVAAGMATRLLTHRATRRQSDLAVVAVTPVVPLVLGMLGSNTTPDLFATPPDPPRQCTEHNGIEYCVHQGHRTELDDLVATLDPVFAARGPQDQVRRVLDRALLFDDPLDTPPKTHVVVLTPENAMNDVEARRNERMLLAKNLAGAFACRDRYPRRKFMKPGGDHPSEIAADLSPWLTSNGANVRDKNSFRGVSPDTMRAWLAEHPDEIRTCSLDTVELPS